MNFETENLIALYRQNRLKEAYQLANRLTIAQPDNHQAFNVLGLVLLAGNENDKACISFKAAVKLSPKLVDYQFNLANAYIASLDAEKAKKILNKILKRDKKNVQAINSLGTINFNEQRYVVALDYFKQAIKINKNFLDAAYNIANTYSAMNEYSQAIKCFFEVYLKNKNDNEVKLRIVNLYLKKGDFDQAYEFSKNDAVCLFNIAAYTEAKSELEMSSQAIDECLNIEPENIKYKRLKATILRRKGELEKALSILRDVVYDDVNIETKVFVEFELGKLHDKDKNYAEAFNHYKLANQFNNQINPVDSPAVTTFIEHLNSVYNTLTDGWYSSWKADLSSAVERQPLFMVGFPRSGTTLLDQILDGHSDFVVMEELPIIGDVILEAIRITGGQYPDLLSSINKNTQNKLRDFYFKRVDEQFKYDKSKILVDKLPLNIIEIEMIHLLFPSSKVILSMRHPFDVCLSNYMQHYSINGAMLTFNSLESTVITYDKVMRLWDKYIAVMPSLQAHVVCYEKLVDDIEVEVKALIEFLGVEWQPKILDFHLHALSRKSLNTPSYQQVTQSVYTTSRYRWKNYEKYIVDHFKFLNKYVQLFNYDI